MDAHGRDFPHTDHLIGIGELFIFLQCNNMLCALHASGIIRLRRSPPPKLRGLQYVLNVTATDDNAAGGPLPLSSSAQVIVGINDVNNNKPVFEEVRHNIHQYLTHLANTHFTAILLKSFKSLKIAL